MRRARRENLAGAGVGSVVGGGERELVGGQEFDAVARFAVEESADGIGVGDLESAVEISFAEDCACASLKARRHDERDDGDRGEAEQSRFGSNAVEQIQGEHDGSHDRDR